jgi:AbrB family looped-hinge helix DNA binding protein
MKSETDMSEPPKENPRGFDWDEHFFGTATVGERGQIVIPADARKRFDIEPGDKMLILCAPGKNGLMLCKLSAMRDFMSAFQDALARVEQEITETTPTRRDTAGENLEEQP